VGLDHDRSFGPKPVFHPKVWIGNNILLKFLPSIGNGFLSLLCKTRDFIAKSIGLAYREELNKQSIGTLVPCIYRITIGIIASLFLAKRKERDED